MIITTPGQVSPHFRAEEFACKGGLECCKGEIKVSQKLIEMLEAARAESGVPFVINSGYRCPEYNAAVDGAMNSAHLRGYAADVSCTDKHARAKMVIAAVHAGFNRIGVGRTFLHFDHDPTLPEWQCWLY